MLLCRFRSILSLQFSVPEKHGLIVRSCDDELAMRGSLSGGPESWTLARGMSGRSPDTGTAGNKSAQGGQALTYSFWLTCAIEAWAIWSQPCPALRARLFVGNLLFVERPHRPREPTTRHQSISVVISSLIY